MYDIDKYDIPTKYDGCDCVRLFLMDEAPFIGSGYRTVLAKIGYKWVYIYYPPTKSTKRLTRKNYDDILQQTEQRNKRNGYTN